MKLIKKTRLNKKYIRFVVKNRWFGKEKTELRPTSPSPYTNIIPHTQQKMAEHYITVKFRLNTLRLFSTPT